MNPRSYHTPRQPVSNRVRCPVCHEEVYSRAGVHPQCAVRQSEPPKGKAKPPGTAPGEAEDSQAVEPSASAVILDVPGPAPTA